MPQEAFLRYEAVGIARLLRTRSLSVPFYQRSYSWATPGSVASDRPQDRDQVADFWSDLESSFRSRTSYFLGTVVVAQGSGGRDLVIDGQQRLATTSILIAAIRDKFQAEGEHDFGRSTQQDYLGRFDRRVGADRPVLILSADDRSFYESRIVLGASSLPSNGSQLLVENAYVFLRSKIEGFASSFAEAWRDRLSDLVTWLDEDVQVVAIDVATESDAFLIFETLNDRGADLTIADLLKNFLFSQAADRLDEVRASWIATLTNLNIERVGNQRFTDFARHLLSSKLGPTREREVYQRIKGLVGDSESSVSFALELKESSRLYYALLSSDSDYWAEFPPAVAHAADVLVELNLEQYRPLMLAVLSIFSPAEVTRFVPSLVSWVIRGLSVGSLGAGAAESAFSEAAREIRAGNVSTTEDVLTRTRVGNLVPDDSTFEQSFAVWRVTRGVLARYMLRALEMQRRGEDEPELVVNDNIELVNLEHILPKNAKLAEWLEFTSEEQKSYVHRLGNLTLLQRGPNGRIGNKGWAIKQPVLRGSQLLLTAEAGSEVSWTKDAIERRQQHLANLAVLTWPRLPR